jgi:hypothetical protein
MVMYACKTVGCDGSVEFKERNAGHGATDSMVKEPSRRAAIVLLEQVPQQCLKCRTSYYERELK